MSLLDHVADVAFASSIQTDLILGTYTGSLYCPAPAAAPFEVATASTTITTNIPESTFFQGIFSTDNGTTWLDFNSQIPNLTTPGYAALQTQSMYGYSDPGSLTLVAENNSYYNGTTTTVSDYTFLYKVVIFARPGQGDITPQPVVNPLNFSTAYNYQKIAKDNVASVIIPVASGSIYVEHNLGYIPKVRTYLENFSSAPTTSLYDFGHFSTPAINCYIDTSKVNYFIDNSGGSGDMTFTLYSRVYYDS